jgi:hypothetical protein
VPSAALAWNCSLRINSAEPAGSLRPALSATLDEGERPIFFPSGPENRKFPPQRAAVKAASVRAIRKGLALTASTGAHAAAMGCRGGSRPCNPATRSSGEVQERQAPAGVAGASPRVVPSPPAASPFRNTDGITSGAAGALCRYPAGVAAGDQTCLASDAANLSIASLTHRSFCSSLSALPAP